jgi:hypothetical protein
MTGKLEDELRRVLADPPVPPAGVDDIGGTLATLDRRVARARSRRRAAAGLSVAVVLAGGLAGATTLASGGRPGIGPSVASGTNGSGQAGAPEQRLPGLGLPLSEVPGPPPRAVVVAARGAVSEVTGGTVSGPVRWVRFGAGYLVQIRFTAPVSCRYCRDPAASRVMLRGPVLEVQVAESVPAAPAATAPGSAPPGAGSDRAAAQQSRTRLLALEQATDLSRYGPVGEFTLPPR